MSRSNNVLVFAVLVSLPIPALAYIDPGTGSALIQGLIAAIAAIGVTAKLYWHRLVAFVSRKSSARESAGSQSANASKAPE